MSSAREDVLARVRRALADVPPDESPDSVPVARDYQRGGDATPDELVSRFEERLRDYGAGVHRVSPAKAVGEAVGEACRRMGLRRVVVPPRLPSGWRPPGVEVVQDEGLSAHDLDRIDGAITGCAMAIADTGTIVLDGRARSGRRAITLVPDHHICIIATDQVRGSVPEAIGRLEPAVRSERVPITLISGPSASSDIELSRVEGVHGPRNLLALIVDDAG